MNNEFQPCTFVTIVKYSALKTIYLNQKIFLSLAFISLLLVGYISYAGLGYGNGTWNLNTRTTNNRHLLLSFIIPLFFLVNAYIYRKISKNGQEVKKSFLISHVIVSVLYLFLVSSFACRKFTRSAVAYSIYTTGFLTTYKVAYYSLLTIQFIFFFFLLRLSNRR